MDRRAASEAVAVSVADAKPIVCAPGYFVTREGDVISCLSGTMKRLRPGLCPNGYLTVNLRAEPKKPFTRTVHSLVCEAFHGPKPTPQHEVRHLDGCRTNNFASNLMWGTHSENMKDAFHKHGTSSLPKAWAAIRQKAQQPTE